MSLFLLTLANAEQPGVEGEGLDCWLCCGGLRASTTAPLTHASGVHFWCILVCVWAAACDLLLIHRMTMGCHFQ